MLLLYSNEYNRMEQNRKSQYTTKLFVLGESIER